MKAYLILILSVIILLIFITPSVSQERFIRGSYAIGGGIGFASEDYGDDHYQHRIWNLEIKPNISYFIFNNLAGDLYIRFGHDEEVLEHKYSWGWETVENKIKSSNISIGLGLSYYLPMENTYPFFRTSISYGRAFDDRTRNDEKILGISIGLAVFISKSVALEPEIGYNYGLWSNSTYRRNIYWMSFGIKYYVYEFGLD